MTDGLATPLALIELFGTIVVLGLLMASALRRGRSLTWPVVVAVVFGLVFANPVGVVTKLSRDDPGHSTPVDNGPQWVKLGGLPIAWFVPYDQRRPLAGMAENGPSSDLKLRYGLSFLASTGASTVAAQCSRSIDDPCWRGRADDSPLVHRTVSGKTWVVPQTATSLLDAQGRGAYLSEPWFYEPRLGLASKRALLYWLAVLLVVAIPSARRRVRWPAVGAAVASTVAAGAVLAMAVAVASPEPTAASTMPPLLPSPIEAPTPRREAVTTDLERYAQGCLAREGAVVRNRCSRIDAMTAVDTDAGALAIWTTEANRRMELRTRVVTGAATPAGPSSLLVTSWDQVVDGRTNCEVPEGIQATRLPNGHALVAWSTRCAATGGEQTTILGIELDADGALVRDPFRIVSFQAPHDGFSPRFWLRSTASGRPILAWLGDSSDDGRLRRLFLAPLTPDLQPIGTRGFVAADDWAGSTAITCGETCLIANGYEGDLFLTYVSLDGTAGMTRSLPIPDALIRSELVAAPADGRFYVGWLQSDGAGADALITTVPFSAGRPRTEKVETGISFRPVGHASQVQLPAPFGITTDRRAPELVWQSLPDAEGSTSLHTSSSVHRPTRASDETLSRTSLMSDGTLIGIAARWPYGPGHPVAVVR